MERMKEGKERLSFIRILLNARKILVRDQVGSYNISCKYLLIGRNILDVNFRFVTSTLLEYALCFC